jgi:aspartokinase-like uncharacterized kinase
VTAIIIFFAVCGGIILADLIRSLEQRAALRRHRRIMSRFYGNDWWGE